MKIKSEQIVYGLLVMVMFSGCMMRELKKDRECAEGYKIISGTLSGEQVGRYPVVVVLWGLEEASQSRYQLAEGNGHFRFFADTGKYYLMAFEDSNKDGVLQKEKERFGMLKKPAVLDMESPESLEGLTLRLLPAGKLPIPLEVRNITSEEKDVRFRKSKAATGKVTTLDNPHFTAEYAHMGLWEPLTFLDKVDMRLYFLEPYSKSKIPVLFVHGANGLPTDFRDIIAQMERTKFQPWVLFYPTGAHLDELGQTAAQMISEAQLEYKFDELIVVAHSMGGLVSRATILNYAMDEDRALIPLYITFSTPWNGHSAAESGVKHAPAVVPAWYEMLPGSPFIEGLFSKSLPEETRHYLFFSFKGKGGSLFEEKNTDGAVSIESQLSPAAQTQATRLIGVNANHIGILSDTFSIGEFNKVLLETGKAN